ncbi:fasciclin-like arabinogalactan protein 11 [Senna tora]|uniref:Fasciclin-like arabinogalactan protein 11 n=1 Tax=Senna tora TaxID=362788 RepID=A0A834TJU2_9FABA|nr:fasciclin-like arabinogalactan protein 11 [Senna tora]
MKNQSLFFTLLILLSSFCSITTTSAQSPPASSPKLPPKPSPSPNLKPPAPAPAKPLVPTLPQSPESSSDSTPNDITKILKKAKVFSVFVRLLKTTEIINNINSQLITAKAGGLTILAPDDSAFSELKAGFMNTLNGGQKIELLQFHILPTYVASNNFDSLNNPVQTLAGVENPARLQLNVTTYGDSVNITTGVVNATIKGVVYSDKQLAIYRMDKQTNSYNVFIRLLKSTQLINQINTQLATTKSGGMTILAPDDGAFSELKPGFLNTLSDGQKLELLQFHILPDYISTSNFDTLTNPVRTLASANPKKAQLNVTSVGGGGANVNVSTGVVNTTLNGVLYTDNHLNIYKVGKVLLPQEFFSVSAKTTPSPAPAPAKAKAKGKAPEETVDDSPKAKAPKAEKAKPVTPSGSSASQSSQVVPTEVNSGGSVGMSLCGVLVGGFVVGVMTI